MERNTSSMAPSNGDVEERPHFKRPRVPMRREATSLFRPAEPRVPGRRKSESSVTSSSPPRRRGVQRRSGFYHSELLRGAVLASIALQQEGTGVVAMAPTLPPHSKLLRGERRRKFEDSVAALRDTSGHGSDNDSADDNNDDGEDDEDTISDNLPSSTDDEEEEEEVSSTSGSDEEAESPGACLSNDSDGEAD